jgi:hypothetical protein
MKFFVIGIYEIRKFSTQMALQLEQEKKGLSKKIITTLTET